MFKLKEPSYTTDENGVRVHDYGYYITADTMNIKLVRTSIIVSEVTGEDKLCDYVFGYYCTVEALLNRIHAAEVADVLSDKTFDDLWTILRKFDEVKNTIKEVSSKLGNLNTLRGEDLPKPVKVKRAAVVKIKENT